MAKTIPISDELYDLLAKLKRTDGDFTAVIFRLLGSRAKKEGFLAWNQRNLMRIWLLPLKLCIKYVIINASLFF